MICRHGHAHPPFSVTQTVNPINGRHGPLHCELCRYTNTSRTDERLWTTYTDSEMIQALLLTERRCKSCFPDEP